MINKARNTGKSLKRNVLGFTLVELMIVIAVIALLILVLAPRIGTIKNKSREAGIRTNMVMLEGMIQTIIDDYGTTDTDVDNFELRLAADIDSVTIANQKLRNPVSGGTDAVDTDASSVVATTVAAYSTGDDTDNGTAIDAEWTATLANSAGSIAFCAYENTVTGKLNVRLIPYGANNGRITALEKVISQ